MLRRGLLLALVAACCAQRACRGRLFPGRLTEMPFSDGELPHYRGQQPERPVQQRVVQTPPNVQLDEPGEAYLQARRHLELRLGLVAARPTGSGACRDSLPRSEGRCWPDRVAEAGWHRTGRVEVSARDAKADEAKLADNPPVAVDSKSVWLGESAVGFDQLLPSFFL